MHKVGEQGERGEEEKMGEKVDLLVFFGLCVVIHDVAFL